MQANLNQSAVASLGSKVPMELFTGLPVTTPLDTCLIPEAAHPLNQVDLGNVEESVSSSERDSHWGQQSLIKRVRCRHARLHHQQGAPHLLVALVYCLPVVIPGIVTPDLGRVHRRCALTGVVTVVSTPESTDIR
ncbi:unnamed protein product [Phytophthora fragariaefolia]|uniref:Unnamed protein product n=1 Tax=Phytophthora fragariaefolia TaxID=1490495 RepID=A0A9W7D610_9STRA|nr:unnamed protein product [Phytophthora fragariaefolia]